jgi:hypothetical protein
MAAMFDVLVVISSAQGHHAHASARLAAGGSYAQRPFVDGNVGFGTGECGADVIFAAVHIIANIATAVAILGLAGKSSGC